MFVSLSRLLSEVDQQQVLREYQSSYEAKPMFEDELLLARICELASEKQNGGVSDLLQDKIGDKTRVLYRFSCDGKGDIEFVSFHDIKSKMRECVAEAEPIDESELTMEDIGRACMQPLLGTPLLLTPISQSLEYQVWIPDAMPATDDVEQEKARIAADILANELTFGTTLEDAESAKHSVYAAAAPVAMSVGVIPSNVDELFHRITSTPSIQSKNLDMDSVKSKIAMYNARMEVFKMMDREVNSSPITENNE